MYKLTALAAAVSLTGCAAIEKIATDAGTAATISAQQQYTDRSEACAEEKGSPCAVWEVVRFDL